MIHLNLVVMEKSNVEERVHRLRTFFCLSSHFKMGKTGDETGSSEIVRDFGQPISSLFCPFKNRTSEKTVRGRCTLDEAMHSYGSYHGNESFNGSARNCGQ